MASSTAARGLGATVFSPLPASCAKGHTSVTFSSQRSSKPLFHRTGCAGANRRRPGTLLLCHCVGWNGLRNCGSCMPYSRGLPLPRRSRRSSVVAGDPGRRQGAERLSVTEVGMRRDGGGSHRLAGPGREQLRPRIRTNVPNGSSNTRQIRSSRALAGRQPVRLLVRS